MPKKVDLDGVELELDDEVADKVIAARQATKEKIRTLSEQVQAVAAREAEAKARADAAAKEAEVAKLTSKGEYEAALKIKTEDHDRKINKLKTDLKTTALKSAILGLPGFMPHLVDDFMTLIGSNCDYDLENGSLVVIGEGGRPKTDSEGKPLSVDAFLSEALDKRSNFRAANAAPGSGAAHGKPALGTPVKTITRAEYDIRLRDPAQSTTTARDIAAGRLKIAE